MRFAEMARSLLRIIAVLLLLTVQTGIVTAKEVFFPPGSLSDRVNVQDAIETWYSKHLRSMGEVPVYPAVADLHLYRLTWLRAFHHPMVFRLEVRSNGTAKLYTKMTDGKGGYAPGKLILSEEKHLTKTQVDKLLNILNSMPFWTAPSLDDKHGMDGARWILEGVSDGLYHVVDRWSPEPGEFLDWSLLLMQLSGQNLGPLY